MVYMEKKQAAWLEETGVIAGVCRGSLYTGGKSGKHCVFLSRKETKKMQQFREVIPMVALRERGG